MMIEKLYTVEEVAEMASVTGRTIRNYLKSGRLVGRKIGGQWRFPEAEVQRLLTGAEPEPAEQACAEVPAAVEEIPPSAMLFEPRAEAPASLASAPVPQQEKPVDLPVQNPPRQPAYYNEPAPLPSSALPHQEAQQVPAQPQGGAPAPQTAATPAPLPEMQVPPAAPAAQQPTPATQPQPVAPYEAPAASYLYAQQPQQVTSAPQAAPGVSVQPLPAAQPTQAAQPVPQQGYPASGVVYQAPMMPQPAPEAAPSAPYPGVVPAQPLFDAQTGQPVQPFAFAPLAQLPSGYIPAGYYAYTAGAYPAVDTAQPPQPAAAPSKPEEPVPQPTPPVQPPRLSDVGDRVTKYIAEVHDYSKGPQVCCVVDLHQSLSAARITSERLAEIADEESEDGQLCQSFVEFDERYYVARYTLFGTTPFLLRCLKLIG